MNTDEVNDIISRHPQTSLKEINDRLLKIANQNDDELALFISELVFKGNLIYRVERKKENLETIFLNLTKKA